MIHRLRISWYPRASGIPHIQSGQRSFILKGLLNWCDGPKLKWSKPSPQKKDWLRCEWYMGDSQAWENVSGLRMPWFVAHLNWQTGDLGFLEAAFPPRWFAQKKKKKWKRPSRNSAASFGKRSHISLLVFRAGEKTNGWSPVIDFSEGWLGFCSVKCSIKQNFPPKVCGCVKSGK